MWPDNQTAPAAAYSNGGSAKAGIGVTMPLDELAKQLESASIRVGQMNDRVRTIADGLFGGEPEAKAGGSAKPPTIGRINGLNDQAQSVHFWLNELERQIRRLDPLG